MTTPREVIDAFLDEEVHELTVIARNDTSWDVLVPSYWRERIALSLNLGEAHLRGDAFFLRAPDENREQAFALLLRRNERSHVWKFAVNEVGDVSLNCELPIAAIGTEELDVLFGSLVSIVDETYVPYMKTAFASALEEQIAKGGPGLDRPPWADEWEGRIPK
jgi:hypothetical protein